MSQTAVRPAGSPWLIPYLTVQDAGKALDFYKRAFGFRQKGEPFTDKEGQIRHAELEWQDAWIMCGSEVGCDSPSRSPATSGTASPVNLYIYCEDVDTLFARATAAGAKGEIPPSDMFWGDRMCKLVDPDGHSWSFATHTGKVSAPCH
jgi:uncharacterized glyoxalase superfamily protein PhnB